MGFTVNWLLLGFAELKSVPNVITGFYYNLSK